MLFSTGLSRCLPVSISLRDPVSPGPLSSPPVVREVRGGVYDVCYTAEQGGADQTTEVTWDGEPVPGRWVG